MRCFGLNYGLFNRFSLFCFEVGVVWFLSVLVC